GVVADLKRIVGSTAHVAIYIANGHGGWEAVSNNLFSAGDRVLIASSGRFGMGWYESLGALGVAAELLDFGLGQTRADRIAEVLSDDTAHTIKAVLVTHVDTASTIRNDVQSIRQAMDRTGHPALLAVDGIASVGSDPLLFDEWGL